MKLDIQSIDSFAERHIGPTAAERDAMLSTLGVDSLDTLIDQTIPSSIRSDEAPRLPRAVGEYEFVDHLKRLAAKNTVCRQYIGLGYYETIVPAPIQRNILENPGWYTQYTPYQAEISQGRLEALLNFQTVVADLTAMELANASLLDEGTAAAEAMIMTFGLRNKKARDTKATKFLVHHRCFPQTIDVLKTRAEPIGIELVIADPTTFKFDESVFGCLLQYPDGDGAVADYRDIVSAAHEHECYAIFAADLLSLALLTPPGEIGADVVVGNTQRFGVPLGFGGPHAAYFAARDEFKRQIPGRIIGISEDSQGAPALRMALQTREQHIKREKATSNICTAQALLAIMAGMYAVYHGPEGIKARAFKIHILAKSLEVELSALGYIQLNEIFFDTLKIDLGETPASEIKSRAEAAHINFRYYDDATIGISLGETTEAADLRDILTVFAAAKGRQYDGSTLEDIMRTVECRYPEELMRTSEFMTHAVFHSYRSESELMRYIKRLENRDLSLTSSMIPLGSCTMKLNAATELLHLSWPEFSNIHPFAPSEQAQGYSEIIVELERYLAELTGFTATSLQPNSGAQGEYSGLLVIRAYHLDRGDVERDVVIIPSSAHGTNPASAVMAGMRVVITKCKDNGEIDVDDLRAQAERHKSSLAALMVTYPSTHGVFEESIVEVCDIIHANGGLVYMDGANMNAQNGLTSPANIGADVCHLNLHKTFAIPHGGGGPGMGPICCTAELAPYLPGHPLTAVGGDKAISAISAAPWGSGSILLISYAYIRLLGPRGLTEATRYAILNANYLKTRLEEHYPVLFTGANGRVAHEFIIDFRQFKKDAGVVVEDIAKRLIDYGYHAPTVSFPVAGTLMIEPTESEGKAELDRFCEALIGIRREIQDILDGLSDKTDNPLKNAPHTSAMIADDNWEHPYSRGQAAFPAPYVRERKFWPAVSRVNNTLGDRTLICTCPPIEDYVTEESAT